MIRVGIDYYPEHWNPEWWEMDARLMASAGIDTVRVAEFSWGVLEPSEGEFHFDWLDEVISIFDRHGIDVILGTPTNCAPVWLYTKYPHTRQMDRDGNRTPLGIRGHRCMTDSTFRRYAARIVHQMARRYANHPRVVAWQIDNEPEGNHCCCPSCAADFHAYLREKYGTIQNVNLAWGNDVWSGQYEDFESILPPLGSAYKYGWMNPAYLLDYEKWASNSCGYYLRVQRDLIRGCKPDAVITTNACFNPNTPDFHALFRDYDVASYDNYPEVRIPEDPEAFYSQAFALDLIRGYKRKNFWILEQLSGPKGCWMPMSPTPLPGMLKGYAWQTIARGADLLLFFRWRSARSGAEMFWHGLFDEKNPSGRRYEEFVRFIRELREVPDPCGTKIKSRVAILYSYVQDRAFRIQPQSEGFSYWEQLKLWHDGFLGFGVNIDVVGADAPLDGYDVVVAPTQYVENQLLIERLESFAQAGGTVVLTNRTGVKTPENNRITEHLPNGFRSLAGCFVREYDPIGNLKQSIDMGGESYEVTRWCDVLEAETAQVLAIYADSFYKGGAAVTVNAFGAGRCYYVGTVGNRDFYHSIAVQILSGAGIPFYEGLPRGIEISTRQNDTSKWVFLFNNTQSEQRFDFCGELCRLSPFEMRVVMQQRNL